MRTSQSWAAPTFWAATMAVGMASALLVIELAFQSSALAYAPEPSHIAADYSTDPRDSRLHLIAPVDAAVITDTLRDLSAQPASQAQATLSFAAPTIAAPLPSATRRPRPSRTAIPAVAIEPTATAFSSPTPQPTSEPAAAESAGPPDTQPQRRASHAPTLPPGQPVLPPAASAAPRRPTATAIALAQLSTALPAAQATPSSPPPSATDTPSFTPTVLPSST
ncbi:MAG TPA: hypothetical protein PKK15_20105, partial [Kouleothrix sp.]|nr:hypothetical protein [Kouleothrix sp.]